jgi:hypothetical protein
MIELKCRLYSLSILLEAGGSNVLVTQRARDLVHSFILQVVRSCLNFP